MSRPKGTYSTILTCDRKRRTAKILASGKLTVRNSVAWCLAKTIVIPKTARDGHFGGHYRYRKSIVSAICEAKADSRPLRTVFPEISLPLRVLQWSQITWMLLFLTVFVFVIL